MSNLIEIFSLPDTSQDSIKTAQEISTACRSVEIEVYFKFRFDVTSNKNFISIHTDYDIALSTINYINNLPNNFVQLNRVKLLNLFNMVNSKEEN